MLCNVQMASVLFLSTFSSVNVFVVIVVVVVVFFVFFSIFFCQNVKIVPVCCVRASYFRVQCLCKCVFSILFSVSFCEVIIKKRGKEREKNPPRPQCYCEKEEKERKKEEFL